MNAKPNIVDKNTFSQMVEEHSVLREETCLETILYLIEIDKVDPDSVPDLLNERLKTQIRIESEDINLLPKTKKLKL